jgi:hypothetical protein
MAEGNVLYYGDNVDVLGRHVADGRAGEHRVVRFEQAAAEAGGTSLTGRALKCSRSHSLNARRTSGLDMRRWLCKRS